MSVSHKVLRNAFWTPTTTHFLQNPQLEAVAVGYQSQPNRPARASIDTPGRAMPKSRRLETTAFVGVSCKLLPGSPVGTVTFGPFPLHSQKQIRALVRSQLWLEEPLARLDELNDSHADVAGFYVRRRHRAPEHPRSHRAPVEKRFHVVRCRLHYPRLCEPRDDSPASRRNFRAADSLSRTTLVSMMKMQS